MKFKKLKYKKVNSTNDTAIRIIKNYNLKFGMIVSDTQVNGKGQRGNKWFSYKGNLFVSFFHELKNLNISLNSLTEINCLLVKKILNRYYKKNITFKKPNDLLINKKKISGILQEIISISDKKFLIIGIGVNLVKSPKIKDYPTTSLFELTNNHINKSKFENQLKQIFEKHLTKMYKIGNKFS
jgi:BirA family biotin operon repressor/biotin-[acetyl-CoA-carboxylase] ligase